MLIMFFVFILIGMFYYICSIYSNYFDLFFQFPHYYPIHHCPMNGIQNLNVLKKNSLIIWILVVIQMNLFLSVGHIMVQKNLEESIHHQ
jgi:hypothetical protein